MMKCWKLDTYRYLLHFVKMHANCHMSYDIFAHKHKQTLIITLQKEQENPLKISFCFSKRWYNLHVDMWALRLYHRPHAIQKCLKVVQSQCPRVDM